ncbi:TPA: hypothetical protein DEP34_00570 [Candidatus Uhrbacteria bacterium]|uniref:Uncharacterized protein n=2 Tax=Candidatus Uhriibacteriota TaxID=1752732 RepID=A0A0G1T744_9BACT|nr:MAG: hypothetical protein UX45_C0003G0039 [Candidatus Uhrbacteria bacterium GW2011_GWF2_46_218]KKU41210.1 MAG: hypothetical protein UX57_C0005G0040 [Candidatus Uhrbacteria bacterium GW2011_GWE2_46_68]HBK34058.1 hypothetical protein [Candidatus Uhrbacteria bacterium]HCB18864.1 hypothetical protein [Candidatus Uhrbacteria bacterium]
MSRRITVIIDPKSGRSNVDVDIPPGPGCRAVAERMKVILDLLGAGIEEMDERSEDPGIPQAIPNAPARAKN